MKFRGGACRSAALVLLVLLFAWLPTGRPVVAGAATTATAHAYDLPAQHAGLREEPSNDFAVDATLSDRQQSAVTWDRSVTAASCVAAEDGGLLFRGVAKTHPGYEDALNGVAKPRGGLASAAEHNAGDTRSEFTSWTTDRSTAESFSYPGGVVLSVPKASVANRVFGSPDLYDEFEILIRGPVSGARVG